VRIHYISCNEWREADDLIPLNEDENRCNMKTAIIQSFNLYYELGVKIKQELVCGRKQSSTVHIDMGFDNLLPRVAFK